MDSENIQMIGWREWLSIPELGILGIKAKIDTGARTSCLHTHDYEIYHCSESGKDRVRFHLHPLTVSKRIELTCDSEVTSTREVKDSGGHLELRPFIMVKVNLGNSQWDVEFSLSNRESMKFRMLLGRIALKDRFFVDPTHSYLLGNNLSKAYRSTKPCV